MATTPPLRSFRTKRKAGTILALAHDPALVTRPDGEVVTVVGGRYVVEQDGEHLIEAV